MTDHEPFWTVPGRLSQHPGDERHIAFMRGADLVIHDAQYTEEEYRDKGGWGHSPLEYAVDVALAAGARRLVLFHHDPQHDDAAMERMESEARARAAAHGAGPEVLAAREGLELEVRGHGSARDVGAASALLHRQVAGGRVLVVSGNDKEVAAIEEVLGEDALVLLRLADVPAALSRGAELRPDLAIIDRELLARVPLFGSLTNEERELLLAQASEEVFAAGHSILQESDPPDRLFVILSGRARALETTPSSPAEVILSEFGEGEILGELAVIRNRPRSATVVATERTHCLVLNQNDFLRVLQTSVGLALALLRTVAVRLAETDRRLSRYAPDPVTGLASRRAFDDQYRRLAAVARRRGTGALMLVLDVVQLRAINDRFGYGVGDDVLRAVADP